MEDRGTEESFTEMTRAMFLTPEQRKQDGYLEFLRSKEHRSPDMGVMIGANTVHPMLFAFQRDIARWSVRKGRAAIFADYGLGKTLMQLEWARHSGKRVLVLCPLSVAQQTIAEGEKIGLTVRFCERPVDEDGIWITNYQKLKHFIGAPYDAIVLDESSILKSLDGKTREMLIKQFGYIPRRLCCTATPSPNDLAELAHHAEFLGVMTRVEMLSQFFVHDAGKGGANVGHWRLKGHAQEAFWKWVATWAVYVRSPADLGYPDDQFQLPPFSIREEKVESVYVPEGELFPRLVAGITGRSQARKATLADRVERARDIINASTEQWVVWCNLNDEGQQLHKLLPDSVLIEGATADDLRVEYEQGWRLGDARILITKPSQYGHGLNWQFCHNVLYLGLSDSFEQYYQSVRRCWRFGQQETVNVVIVTSTAEYTIVQNIKKKEQQAAMLAAGIVHHMKDAMIEEVREEVKEEPYKTSIAKGNGWTLMLGDSAERIHGIDSNSMDLSIFSPPFAQLYTYSPLARDMGNAKDYDEFFTHFKFFIPELLRVTKPGRRSCVHVQQVATTKVKDGVIGWRDFRADVVRHFMEAGWVYDGEIVIDKDPQAQAIRTKSKALMFVQKNKDSSWCRPAMADYILLFRKEGINYMPIVSDVSNEEWIRWARPIWYGIKESNTLNVVEAREHNDEKHICPLQLETIERCVRLWSNPGETVLDPFAGIASTGYEALRLQRRFVGIELKEAYWKVGQKNLRQAETLQSNILFN